MIPERMLVRIDEKYKLIHSQRPLSPAIVVKLKEQFSLEMTYNSNAIEGNKLTLKETFLVINDGLTVKGKSLQDHLEAKNHHEAIHFLYELIEHEKRHTMSEQLVRSLQKLIVRDLDVEDAGNYRKGSVMIAGSKHKPPEAFEVAHLMRDLIVWIKKNAKVLHPVELAAKAHHKLVQIHPFTDGNGRTARLFMNLILMQNGYPLVVILKNDRQKYYRALEKADQGQSADMERFIAQAVERSMSLYLKAFNSPISQKAKLLPLSMVAEKSPFSEKYLNLLARNGKLEAHKEGRNWVSSIESLEKYLLGRERKRKIRKKPVR
ncbi:MAG: Fic family protein [Bdellovibrionales bacterium]|jgi:Fic family protein|nr:Fic family protein [Bdellovibrionales bacterium]